MQKTLVIASIVIAEIGLLRPWLSSLPVGRLPGDILIEREGFRFSRRRRACFPSSSQWNPASSS
jgi:hypothetical protein